MIRPSAIAAVEQIISGHPYAAQRASDYVQRFQDDETGSAEGHREFAEIVFLHGFAQCHGDVKNYSDRLLAAFQIGVRLILEQFDGEKRHEIWNRFAADCKSIHEGDSTCLDSELLGESPPPGLREDNREGSLCRVIDRNLRNARAITSRNESSQTLFADSSFARSS